MYLDFMLRSRSNPIRFSIIHSLVPGKQRDCLITSAFPFPSHASADPNRNHTGSVGKSIETYKLILVAHATSYIGQVKSILERGSVSMHAMDSGASFYPASELCP